MKLLQRRSSPPVRATTDLRLESRPTPWAPLIIGGAMSALVLVGLGASSLVKVDQVVVVPGRLQPIRSTQDIAAPEQGMVTLVLVKEGEGVAKDQSLVVLDTRVLQGQKTALQEQGSALVSIRSAELQRLGRALGEQEARERGLQERLMLTERQYTRLKPLQEQGAYAETQIWEVEKSIAELRAQLEEAQQASQRLRAESAQKQAELASQQAQNRSSLIQNRERLRQIVLRAPVAGTILNLKAKPGLLARSTEPLLQLVPADNLEAKVFVRNQDLAFVRPGQNAEISLDAYDRSKYGTIDGQVTTIGTDVLPPDATYDYPRFPIGIKLARQTIAFGGRKYTLQAGMALSANLKLEKRTLLELFFSQIARSSSAVRTLR
jgi:hemolysin D